MASVRDLKKDINFVLGDIIEAVYIWEYENTDKDTTQSEVIIDDAIATFDKLIIKVNNKNVNSRKEHLNAVKEELETKGKALIDRINAL